MRKSEAVMAIALVLSTTGCSTRIGADDAGRPDASGPCGDSLDTDGDGIADRIESDADPDSDGRPNRLDDDSDGDGLLDEAEAGEMSSPCSALDTDFDGTPDYLDTDSDDDGLTDAEEVELGTDPTLQDTDGDDVPDVVEVRGSRTDPTDPMSAIPETDFYVVLPYQADYHEHRSLLFGTRIRVGDVYILMDTTSSMGGEVANIQARLESVIIPGVQALIPDVQFGAGGFDDFPIGRHGCGEDLPYYHLIDIVPPTQDLGAMGPGGVFASVPTFSPSGANGVADIVDAVRAYRLHFGGNGCESGAHALFQAVSGEGASWDAGTCQAMYRTWPSPAGAIPARSCPSVPDEIGRRHGYPCFRPGALPIIVYVSDAPVHEPHPLAWGLDTLDGRTCNYEGLGPEYDVPLARTYEDALWGIRTVGARVVTLSSDSIPSQDGYPATAHLCGIATDTGTVRRDGTPLCFEIGVDGADIGTGVVNGIAELVGGTPQTVTTRTENVAGNPDGFDATRFIQASTPVEGYAEGVAGTGYSHMDATSFYGVIPGTAVEFDIDFWNDVREPAPVSEVFVARIVVVGNGVTDLDARNAYILVPREGSGPILY